MTEVALFEGRLLAWVPGAVKNPLNGNREHWSKQSAYRKGWRERVVLCVREAARRAGVQLVNENCGRHTKCWHACEPKLIVLTAHTWNAYDHDGLVAALKPVIDGLRDATLIHDDGPASGHRVVYGNLINRKHRGVEVCVQLHRAYEHLPPHLQAVSRDFAALADVIVNPLPRNPERTVALRKVLEAKDAAVRAKLAKDI